MDRRRDLPRGLRPPARGEPQHLHWQADLGAGVQIGELAAYWQDLATAVQLGQRWGLQSARAAAIQLLLNDLRRDGPKALRRAAQRVGYRPRDVAELEDWRWFEQGRESPFFLEPLSLGLPRVLQVLSEVEVPDLLGSPPRVVSASYENPVRVSVAGYGFEIKGFSDVLRLVRDWSAEKRKAEAEADQAEADARKKDAEADEAEDHAKLNRWLTKEVMAGRLPIPIGERMQVVTPPVEAAVRRLAQGNVQLELPAELDPDNSPEE